jgi:uncharacterized protein (DUF1800 family)
VATVQAYSGHIAKMTRPAFVRTVAILSFAAVLTTQAASGPPLLASSLAGFGVARQMDADSATLLSAAEAAHFLNQATFGPSPADVAAVQARGREQWLQEQLHTPESVVSDGLNTSQLRAQLFLNMATGQDQLRQRMVFALSQIFVVSANKVGSGAELAPWVRLLSRNAFGNYRTLLREVTLNPTMGKYLDLAYSRRATRTTSINENYAREVLQLFSIGLWQLNQDGTVRSGGVPTYDQTTVREFARALTGWTFPTEPGQTPRTNNPQYFVGEMESRPTQHDPDAKTLFGVVLPAGQPPIVDLEYVVEVIFTHPNVGPFIATRLIRSLVKSNPTPAYIGRVAAAFNNNGAGVRGDLRATLTAVLLDPEAQAFGSSDGRLKDPILHVIGLGRTLNAQFLDPSSFLNVFSNLSQLVLTPTTVFSFYSPLALLPGRADLFGPEYQIYPPALAIQRANFIYSLIRNSYSSSFRVDLSPLVAVAGNEAALIERVNQALMHGTMSGALKQIIGAAVRTVPSSRTTERAQNAVYLAAISSEYSVYTSGGGPATPGTPGGPGAPGPGAPAAPSAPLNLIGTANRSNLALRWTNPLDGAVPDSMALDVSGPVTISVPLALGDTFSYSGVPNGTYTFAVRAVNVAGSSAPSNVVTLTFPGMGTASCTDAPQAPESFTALRTGNMLSVAWQPPAAGPAPAEYVVSVGGSAAATFTTSGLTLSGAAPRGTYVLNVRSVNACGQSPASASRTISVP